MRSQTALRIAGALITMIGIGHIFMPTLGYDDVTTRGMDARAMNHFYYLGTYAICAFLLGMAALAFVFARRPGPHQRELALVLLIVWAVRLVLELRFPVDVPIFFLANPHPVIVGVLVAIVASLAIAALPRRDAR